MFNNIGVNGNITNGISCQEILNIRKTVRKGENKMTQEEKIVMLEDLLEAHKGTLTPETSLLDLVGWTSIATISLTALLDEKFGKIVNAATINNLDTVADILNLME